MSELNVNTITDASGGNTASINGATPTTDNTMGRNRIINGDMRIDQRNAGASVTPSGGNYTLDRWMFELSQTSKLTVQQNAGAVTPPAGFSNYMGITSSSAYSSIATDYFWVNQRIEGFNTADLAWGTANASAITLSFWVRSSLTGTFSGALSNSSQSRCYPFPFVINSANTWEKKEITVAGDTTGTWATDNNAGIKLHINLGTGSNRQGAANTWASTDYRGGVTGSVSVVGTNGATLYITGVQLEAGSVATSFERRSYGQELALCQRYYETFVNATIQGIFYDGYSNIAGQSMGINMPYKVTKRALPTVTSVGSWSTSNTSGSLTFNTGVESLFAFYGSASSGRVYWYNQANTGFTASAEL